MDFIKLLVLPDEIFVSRVSRHVRDADIQVSIGGVPCIPFADGRFEALDSRAFCGFDLSLEASHERI